MAIIVKDKYNQIYEEGTWINANDIDRLPLTVEVQWQDGSEPNITANIPGFRNYSTLDEIKEMKIYTSCIIDATVNGEKIPTIKINIDTENKARDKAMQDGQTSFTDEKIHIEVDKDGITYITDLESEKCEVSPTITVTDAVSGIDSAYYQLLKTDTIPEENDAKWKKISNEGKMNLNDTNMTEGIYNLYVKAKDKAGNVKIEKVAIYDIRIPNYKIETATETLYARPLNEAISLAEDGSTITQLRDVKDLTAAVINKNITYNTNGKTLTREDAITVNSGKSLNINGTGTIKRENGNLIENSGTVSLADATLESNIMTIKGGTVNMTSGNINGIGEQSVETAGIYGVEKLKMTGGTIKGAKFGIVGTNGLIEISGGTVIGKQHGVIPGVNNASLTISGNARIEGTSYQGIALWSGFKNNGTINITSGTITGGINGIWIESGNTTTVNIGDENATLNTETPAITGETGYGIAMLDANATLNFYNGKIVGKQTTKVRGIDVAFSVADPNKVNYRVENPGKDNELRYGAHTDKKEEIFETTLVEPKIDVKTDHLDLNTSTNKTGKIEVTGDNLGELEFTSDDSTVATVDENGNVTAVGEGKCTVTVKDKNSGKTKTVEIIVDDTAPKAIITGLPTGVTDGLIRHYDAQNNLGDGHSNSTTTWKDLSNHEDGTIYGDPTIEDGYVNLDGQDDWVNLGQITNINTVTLEAEVKLNSIQSEDCSIVDNFQAGGYGFYLRNGKPVFAIYTTEYNDISLNEVLDIDKAYNITGTYDGQTMKLYIDGILHTTKTLSEKHAIKNPDSNTVMAIGVNPVGSATDWRLGKYKSCISKNI